MGKKEMSSKGLLEEQNWGERCYYCSLETSIGDDGFGVERKRFFTIMGMGWGRCFVQEIRNRNADCKGVKKEVVRKGDLTEEARRKREVYKAGSMQRCFTVGWLGGGDTIRISSYYHITVGSGVMEAV